MNLSPRTTSWVQVANILFVDNPVGTGYSYVDEESAYTTNVDEIAQDLLTMFETFLKTHTLFQVQCTCMYTTSHLHMYRFMYPRVWFGWVLYCLDFVNYMHLLRSLMSVYIYVLCHIHSGVTTIEAEVATASSLFCTNGCHLYKTWTLN